MALLERLSAAAGAFFATRSKHTLKSDPAEAFGMIGTDNDAGVPASAEEAATHSVVMACVTAIAEAFATLPVHVKSQSTGETKSRHAAHRLLHVEPNPYQTPSGFRTTMMALALLRGRAVAVIERDETGRPTGIYPHAGTVEVERVAEQLTYKLDVDGRWVRMTPSQVLDLTWMSLDGGVTAVDPVRYARHTIGLSLAVNRYAARFFANGGNVGGILETGAMDERAVDKFVRSWAKKYSGAASAFKVAWLPGGMKYHRVAASPDEGQMLATRQHQVREICRIFRVPPHKVWDLADATWANIEQQQIEWAQGTLLPWAVRWEQEADRKLLLDRERGQLEVKFNLDALLRATTKERYETYQLGRQAGLLTANECRRRENLPPIEGGDTLLSPLNMTPAGGSGGAAARAEATPEPETPEQ